MFEGDVLQDAQAKALEHFQGDLTAFEEKKWPDASPDEMYGSMTLPQLKKACKAKGLHTSGSKRVLIKRLRDDQA